MPPAGPGTSRMLEPHRHNAAQRKGWALRMALAFAAFGAVAAVTIAPAADEAVYSIALKLRGEAGADDFTTASVRRARPPRTRRYTVRRSVLQPREGSCILYSDGTTEGDC